MDYDRSNPLTSKEATLEYLTELEKVEKDEFKLLKIKEAINKLLLTNLFSFIESYGHAKSLEERVERLFGSSGDPNTAKARMNIMSNFFGKAIDLSKKFNHQQESKPQPALLTVFKPKRNLAQ